MREMTGIPDLTYNVKDTLKVLRENKITYVEKYEAAKVIYDEAVKVAGTDIAEMATKLANGGKLGNFNPHTVLNELAEPRNHVDEYDRAICMLASCVELEIKFSQIVFAQLVQDRWDFSGALAHSILRNRNYVASRSL